MYDVVGVGEVLIDFSPSFQGPMGNPGFEMNPGGAPANCLAANAKLGGSCAFVGSVGKDFFGRFLVEQLKRLEIDVENMTEVPELTTIDFVANNRDGEREFAFFRNPGADTKLVFEKIPNDRWLDTKIFHYGTLSFTDEPSASTVKKMLRAAKERNILLSFDPNYRENLWESPGKAREIIEECLQYCDILKISEEEMRLIFNTGMIHPSEALERFLSMGISHVFITMGDKGTWYGDRHTRGFEKAFSVEAVDTTGCGDSFLGTIHYFLLHYPGWNLKKMVAYANAAAAICATGRTGIAAMPEWGQIENLVKEGKRR